MPSHFEQTQLGLQEITQPWLIQFSQLTCLALLPAEQVEIGPQVNLGRQVLIGPPTFTTGARPQGHPVQVQVHQDLVVINS